MSDEIIELVRQTSDLTIDNFNKINGRIDRIETAMQRPGMAWPKDTKADLPRPGRIHYEIKSREDRSFFNGYLRKGTKFLTADEQKTLVLASDPQAGYLAPVEFAREVIRGMSEFSPIRADARVRETNGKSLEVPKRTALPDTYWVSEIAERTEDVSLAYGLEKFVPHEMISFVKVSVQELEDSAFNLGSELAEAFAEAFAVKEGTAFVSGTANGQPEGILTNADVGSTETAAASVIGPNDIMGLPYKIGRGYRNGAKWYMNDTTMALIRLMRADAIVAADGLGPFLWQNSLIGGEPPTLAGYPVQSTPDMPDVADGAYPILFANLRRAYTIVDRVQLSVQRLSERYAEFGIVGFLARKRVDGQVVLPEAAHLLKIQAA